MRILQINNCHYRRGGADVVYLNTGKLLENKGHDVFYFSQQDIKNGECNTHEYFVKKIDYFNKSMFQKIMHLPRFLYSKEARQNIEKLISDLNPEIAHIHTYKGTLTPSILPVLRRKKIPVVITLHDYGFLCPHNLLLDGKMQICERCISGSFINCIVNKCNRNNLVLSTVTALEFAFHDYFIPFNKYFETLIAVSKFGQQLHNNSGRFNKLVKHLYNFFPKLDETDPKYKRGEYFLFYGRLSKEKGTMTLLNAWLSKNRSMHLKFVGTGEVLDDLVRRSNNCKSVEFLGFKQGKELNNIIRNSSFVIVPSEWYENNPLTIIESYSLGKPVIGANVGGIPEIIEDGKTGFLFEMKNIEDLSDKISLAEKMNETDYSVLSKNARKFAEINFNTESHYNELIQIYYETIDKSKNVRK